MKIVLAPNALKGSLSAKAAASAMAAGVLQAQSDSEIIRLPVADGGDGMVAVIAEALDGDIRSHQVAGPRGQKVAAEFCVFSGRPPIKADKAAVVEMALASGLALLAESERDPLLTSTFGTGELIAEALRLGVRHIIVGVGGSATVEGGIGMASALGIRFLDAEGKELAPLGGSLQKINTIDLDALLPTARAAVFEIACDVQNPLLGPSGAARVYAPQKGADPEKVEILEEGLTNLADCIEKDLGINVRALPGGGAAGGLAAGLKAFLGARLVNGVELVLDLVGLTKALPGADLVLTAEGALDSQSSYGKAPVGVARAAKRAGIPCIAIAGQVKMSPGDLAQNGFTAAFSMMPVGMTIEESMHRAEELLTTATAKVIRGFCN
ncbi:MAG: glycerate kinase [Planctomycetes bacterium]|nr:glycerate kinase [Planctomycetota bacterium]